MKLKMTLLRLLLCAFCIAATAANPEDRKYTITTRAPGTKDLPFSNAVLVGDTLYLAGHIGLDPNTGRPPTNPEDEARLVMDLTKQTLEASGMTMDDVVSVQVFCTDLNLYETFNAVYVKYFHDKFPARAFIGTDKLVRGGRFEVMGIAVKRSNSKVRTQRP